MKRVSIRDVAREAGVSITTVSRALNGYSDVSVATIQRIKQVVERLNYAPDINARSLGGKSDKILAYLVSGLTHEGDSGFVFGMLSGLYEVALKNKYEFILLTTNAAKQKEMNYLQLCRLKKIEGVMISGIRTDDPYYTELANSEIPCVIIDGTVEGRYVTSLSIDNISASCDAVSYLLDRGHRNIVMMNGSMIAAVSKLRYRGYEKAFLEHKLEVNPEYVVNGDFDEETAYGITLAILDRHPEITAFFCSSDIMAIGVINAINSLNKKVPEDYSVIGFDDIPAAKYINGGLTTIRQEPFDMGVIAGETLVDMLENDKIASHISIPYTFKERMTVRRLI